jgi:phenylalanine-4-hydroxylase
MPRTAVVSAGHVGMLADPTFAEIVHSIGLASLGADDKTIKHLTKVSNKDKRLQYTVMEYKTSSTPLPDHILECYWTSGF